MLLMPVWHVVDLCSAGKLLPIPWQLLPPARALHWCIALVFCFPPFPLTCSLWQPASCNGPQAASSGRLPSEQLEAAAVAAAGPADRLAEVLSR